MTDPDPRTARDDDEDAPDGISTPAPAEGANDVAPPQPGSPQG